MFYYEEPFGYQGALNEELGKSCYHYSISFTAPFDTFLDKVTNFSGLKINSETIDVRDWKTIEEDEYGTIKINKRKASFRLKNILKKTEKVFRVPQR